MEATRPAPASAGAQPTQLQDVIRGLGTRVRELEAQLRTKDGEIARFAREARIAQTRAAESEAARSRQTAIVRAASSLVLTFARVVRERAEPRAIVAVDVNDVPRVLGLIEAVVSLDESELSPAVRDDQGDKPTPAARPGDATGDSRSSDAGALTPASLPAPAASLFGATSVRAGGDPC